MRVVILAYDFPPFVSVGGLRPYAWFRYLREFGVDPIVVTRQWANHFGDERDYISKSATDEVEVEVSDQGTIIRTPYAPNLSNRLFLSGGPTRHRAVRKLITGFYEVAQYYTRIGPKVGLENAARGYLRNHRVDAIVATAGPFVLFKYAAGLSAEFEIPWVADYRDPWSQDKRQPWIQRAWEARMEREVTASAMAITTASEFFRDLLGRFHHGKQVRVIPNGYDPDAMAAARASDQGHDHLTIAFTGTIYGWDPIESVLRVFDEFIGAQPGSALVLHMIGVGDRDRLEHLMRTKFPVVARNVTFTGRLPNEELALALARANALLLFNRYALPGTKVFEYLAIGRKIVLCYSDDPEARKLKEEHYIAEVASGTDERVLERLIGETNSGVVARDAEHLRDILVDLCREFGEKKEIACRPVDVEKYSRKGSTEQLAHILKGLRT